MIKSPINIGILAHADAGKTSLTEQILFNANVTKQLGSVDKKSSLSDTLFIEKERGISIKNSSLSFVYNNQPINIIDTPGHIDFVSELDKCFSIMDYAILVISAVEGIQGQTIQIWECLKERNIPVIIFINKIDRIGANEEQVFKTIMSDLKGKPYLLNSLNDTELLNLSYENLAEVNDDFMELFLEDNLPKKEDIVPSILKAFNKRQIHPTFIGSAKNNQGIIELLSALAILPINSSTVQVQTNNFFIYKIEHHFSLGKIYHIKNFGKPIIPKSKVQHKNSTLTINQLYKSKGEKTEPISEICNNDIGIITLSDSVHLGDWIGDVKPKFNYKSMASECLKIELKAKNEQQYTDLAKALFILDQEDPALDFYWNKPEKTFSITIQGEIQIEILTELINERFNIEVVFNEIQIIYKETPKQKSIGYIRYWMPKPCWAILTFEIEPGELNSGVIYSSKVGVNDVSQKYQNEIERAIPWALEQGLKGWEVTDLKITLIKGEEHQVHSNPGDFLLATPMGIMQGLKESDTILLEPTYKITMKFHQDNLGKISTELSKINSEIGLPEFDENNVFLTAITPVAQALKFPIIFNSITSGKGRLSLKVNGYKPTTYSKEKERVFKGVNPLDQAQWILHNRGAYKADERKR